MIVAQSTSVTPGQIVSLPAACMQRNNPAPAIGARFFSRAKAVSSPVQQCQQRCLGNQDIQSCVWACESRTSSSPEIIFRTEDACNDGLNVAMRFSYHNGREFINWATGVLDAGGDDTVTRVGCAFSNVDRVCYGARVTRSDGSYFSFGRDVDGSKSCANCCYPCPTTGQTIVPLRFGCSR